MQILGIQKTTLLDYPGEIASTVFTGGCNYRCPYCHNGNLVLHASSMSAISEDTILNHLRKRRHTLTGVCITGGEPTLHSDLPDFIRRIRALGYLVKLDTNGSRPERLREFMRDGLLDYIAMDIKHSPGKYASVVCHSSFSLTPIQESVSLLLKNHVPYEFRTTVTSQMHTAEDMEAIGQWIHGATRYYIQPYRQSEAVISPIFTAPGPEQLQSFVSAVSPYVETVEIRGTEL